MPCRKRFNSDEEYAEWYRKYRDKNRKKMRMYNRQYNKKWREENGYHNEYKWKSNHKTEHNVHQRLKIAVKKKKIIKTECINCGSNENIVGHHEDYNKPFDVLWLCKVCHYQLHCG